MMLLIALDVAVSALLALVKKQHHVLRRMKTMKCNQKRVIAKQNSRTLDTLTAIAKDTAIRELRKQTADIVNRSRNKMYLAMLQAGLSVRTIMRVQKELLSTVEPWYAQFVANKDNPEAGEGVADFALQDKLKSYDIEFIPVQEEL
jgi:hypothetical protein